MDIKTVRYQPKVLSCELDCLVVCTKAYPSLNLILI